MTNLVVVMVGMGAGLGCLGLASAGRLRSLDSAPTRLRSLIPLSGVASWWAAGAALGALGWLLTGWPAVGILAFVGTGMVGLIRKGGTTAASFARLEAIAGWTELLRDTLVASAGLGQAITVTAPVTPVAIREPVGRLSARVSSGVEINVALQDFADELEDPTADVVVAALILANSARVQRLADLLGTLAEATREEVAMRLRVETSRASARSGVRTVATFSVGFIGLLAVVARSYLTPFSTPTGQVVLLFVGALYIAGLGAMVRLVRPGFEPRLLHGANR